MIDCAPIKTEFGRRIGVVRLILNSADPIPALAGAPDISRESRGMAIVLIYAAYEYVLKEVCREVLSRAGGIRVGARRLKPGFRVFAGFAAMQALTEKKPADIWREYGLDLVGRLGSTKPSETHIPTHHFPHDGSHMKSGQVRTICDLFGAPDPAPVLGRTWDLIDGIVSERNAVAHGQLTPEEVGRRYSSSDIRSLVDDWETGWIGFLDWIEGVASTREFFRHP